MILDISCKIYPKIYLSIDKYVSHLLCLNGLNSKNHKNLFDFSLGCVGINKMRAAVFLALFLLISLVSGKSFFQEKKTSECHKFVIF